MIENFIFVELHPLVSKVPFPFVQSRKTCAWGNSTELKAQPVFRAFIPWESRGRHIRLVPVHGSTEWGPFAGSQGANAGV